MRAERGVYPFKAIAASSSAWPICAQQMPILPVPAEDEFAPGYLGRLAHLNLAASSDKILKVLLASYGFGGGGGRLKTLAKAAGMTSTEFLRAHTLAPGIVCGADVIGGVIGGWQWMPGFPDQRNPLKLMRRYAYFCEICLSEQRKKLGFGFWHRVHQLPGVYWCPWHKSPLLRCEGRLITGRLPSCSLPLEGLPAPAYCAIDHPVLNRYNDVIVDFLRSPRAIVEVELLFLLAKAAKKRGINTTMWASDEPFLSDIVFDCVPHWWLEDVLDISSKKSGHFCMEIDDAVVVSRVGTRVFALATAIILGDDTYDLSEALLDRQIICID